MKNIVLNLRFCDDLSRLDKAVYKFVMAKAIAEGVPFTAVTGPAIGALGECRAHGANKFMGDDLLPEK